MQRVGLVMRVGSSGSIIVKAEKTPRIGEAVVDENLKPVGKVFDIFGPVSAPYIAVRPAVREAEKLVSKMLYVITSRGERR